MTDKRIISGDSEGEAGTQRLATQLISCIIVVLGFFSMLQGVLLDVSSDEHARFAGYETPFVGLVYFSPLFGGVLGFFSPLAASLGMLAVGLCALAILCVAGWGSDPLGLGRTSYELASSLALRPITLSLVYLALWRRERGASK